LIAVVIGSAGSLAIMDTNIWIPIIMAVGTKSLNIVIVFIFVDPDDSGSQSTPSGFHLVPSEDDDLENEAQSHATKPDPQARRIPLLFKAVKATMSKYSFVLIICILHEAGNSFRGILPYWLSKEYEWSLREVGFVSLAEKILTALIVTLLPRIPTWILSSSFNGRTEKVNPNLTLSCLCLAMAALGTAFLGYRGSRVSAILSLAVLAVGSGFRDAYLSYVNGRLQKHEIVKVCMAFSMAGYMAINTGVFLVGGLYSLCLRFGAPWMVSIPIWLCTVFLAWTLLLLRRSE
jgi:hypothetical protein